MLAQSLDIYTRQDWLLHERPTVSGSHPIRSIPFRGAFPVVIGDASPDDRNMAQGLFDKFQWLDLRMGDLAPLEKLLPLILEVSDRYDPDINTEIGVLIAGPDNRRQVALGRLIEQARSKRAPISAKLREELAHRGTTGPTSNEVDELRRHSLRRARFI